jgi:phosphoribosylformylglycinamidine cyclo-ligase
MQKTGNVEEKMMYNTYNMGLGLVFAVDKNQANAALKAVEAAGEKAYIVGKIEAGEKGIILK